MIRRKRRKERPPRPAEPRNQDRRPPRDWQWWIVAAAIPLALCASRLNLDLWYDEAYTLDVFVSQPWVKIASDYSAPNNHVLYSLLLRPVYLASDSEFFLRLPSFAFTVGTLWFVFRLTRRWAGLPAGALATLFLGLTQMFLIHTMEVRGYGLSMFLGAWLGDLALAESRVETSGVRSQESGLWALDSRLLTIAVVGAAFLYVLPSNLLFFIPLATVALVWTAVRDRVVRSTLRESAAWGGALLLAGLVYLPIGEQVLAAGGGQAGASLSSLVSLASRVFSTATRDWLPVLPLAALGLAWWAQEAIRRPSRGQVGLPLLTAAMLVGPFCLTGLVGILPFERNYCPLLPFLAVAVGWLMAELIGAAGRLVRLGWSDTVTALVGMALLAGVALPRIWTYPARLAEERLGRFAQDGYYNYYAADFHPSEAVSYLKEAIGPNEPYRICFADADHFPLWHYFRREGMPLERTGESPTGAPTTVVHLIAPAPADYEALSAKSGISVEALRRLPPVKDFGYYRLYRSPPE